MIHCAKCGAELIGSRKFCAACGAPAGDPRSPAASTGQSPAAPGSVPGSAPGSSPSPAGSSGPNLGPSIQYAPAPVSQVNPFAQTAGPQKNIRSSDYGPPPAAPPISLPPELASTARGDGAPNAAALVSPLAVSNVVSERGAFSAAIGPASRQAAAGAAAGAASSAAGSGSAPAVSAGDASQSSVKRTSGVPGTQAMESVPHPSAAAASAAGSGPPAPVGKRQEKTQLLGAFPQQGMPPSMAASANPPGAHAASPSGAPSAAGVVPPAAHSSASRLPAQYGPAPVPMQQQQHAHPQHAQQPPPQQAHQPHQHIGQPQQPVPSMGQPTPGSWNVGAPGPSYPPQQAAPASPYMPMPASPAAPMPPGAALGYGFGYAPGSRVTVTWSNGQRYPGTVQQVSGSQCLVVFPDGQQHWVEMQYLAPA